EYLVRFVALADELNTRFTIVVVPHAAQIRREFPQNRYQRTITEMAGRLRTSVIDPLPVFRRDYAEHKRWPVIPFDGHYEAAGRRSRPWSAAGTRRSHVRSRRSSSKVTSAPTTTSTCGSLSTARTVAAWTRSTTWSGRARSGASTASWPGRRRARSSAVEMPRHSHAAAPAPRE